MHYVPTPEGHQIYLTISSNNLVGFACVKTVNITTEKGTLFPVTFEKIVMLRSLYDYLLTWSCRECVSTLFTQFQCDVQANCEV